MLAFLLKELFTIPFEHCSPYLPKCKWWGCSDGDAGASAEVTSRWTIMGIQGRSGSGAPCDSAFVQTLPRSKVTHPRKSDCRWAVTTKEMSMLCCSTSRPTILMELVLQLHKHGRSIAPNHIPESLTPHAPGLPGFSGPLPREGQGADPGLCPSSSTTERGLFQFLPASTQNPVTGFGGDLRSY